MEWNQIKQSVVENLSSRDLKDPNIRLRALDNIEEILQNNLPQFIQDPTEFEKIDKDTFKKRLAEIKGRNLNSAESSVINEIYYRVSSVQCVTCPQCKQMLSIPKEVANESYLQCLICGKNFKNPLFSKSAEKGNNNSSKIIGGIVLFLIIVFMIVKCSSDDSPDNITAYVMGQQYIKERLKSPSTAKFPASAASDVQILQSKNIWTIRGYVDSQNSFGATIRTHYSIKMEYIENKQWRLINLDFD